MQYYQEVLFVFYENGHMKSYETAINLKDNRIGNQQ